MIARTFSDVSNALRRVSGQAGLRADDPRLYEVVNLAQERLLSMVEYPVGSLHRLKFCQYDKTLALPAKYQRIVKATVARDSSPVMNAWYEFMDYGPGHQDTCAPGVNALIDRGESPVIRKPPSFGWKVRAYGYEDERVDSVRPKIRVMGYDENRQWVRTESDGVWSDGIELEIRGDANPNYEESSVYFSEVTQVIKPRTNGTVELYFIDEYDEPLLAGRYEFWETNPSFRIYHAPWVNECEGSLVHALCRVRLTPVTGPTDKLLISSLPALRKAARAIAHEDADEVQLAEANWQIAANILRSEAKEYYGTSNPPVDVTASGVAYGDVPNVI